MANETEHPRNLGSIHPFARSFLWLGNEKVKESFMWLPLIGLAVTIVAAFIYPFDDHHKAPWDFFASWAVIGFVAYSVVVLSAEPLFRLLARPENYYEEDTEPENIVPSVYDKSVYDQSSHSGDDING